MTASSCHLFCMRRTVWLYPRAWWHASPSKRLAYDFLQFLFALWQIHGSKHKEASRMPACN